MAYYKTTKQIELQSKAFIHGLSALIPLSWLNFISPDEFQLLLCGTTKGGFHASSPCILWFWEVLEEMSEEERSEFLMFVTSSARAPLVGFHNLNPSFTIHKVPAQTRLPSSSTCVNLLKLPDYGEKTILKEKLFQAIKNAHGFGLS
ncbi:hypothetical protein IE077_003394 [Cardiosporidium cionae]|uniref:HECT-type E3 ubiquitin transferase n=1 Tax=Cardiosporidium cionae TaxID=476202 RepID=A0ABQ7JF15_9APIC|nr:hypothetical protein IE077_003394 [Cardiosporidium cionae]|eukprot:KAF8822597.1 hypothetical protein IE077_003394 [Cardiosporidium cionae]